MYKLVNDVMWHWSLSRVVGVDKCWTYQIFANLSWSNPGFSCTFYLGDAVNVDDCVNCTSDVVLMRWWTARTRTARVSSASVRWAQPRRRDVPAQPVDRYARRLHWVRPLMTPVSRPRHPTPFLRVPLRPSRRTPPRSPRRAAFDFTATATSTTTAWWLYLRPSASERSTLSWATSTKVHWPTPPYSKRFVSRCCYRPQDAFCDFCRSVRTRATVLSRTRILATA